ncbi:pyridoxal-dependent decarboxylase [bacterium]|nr:pyridoxal-dependent decarboxylase [bacterium]
MENYRKALQQLEDWMVDYWENGQRYPVLSQVKPGEIIEALPKDPPRTPEPFERVLEDFQKIILPGVTHWNHPNFYAYFAITGSPPGILGDMLSTALNINAMLWKTSPASTELEVVVLDWLRKMLGIPVPLFGIIMDTASIGTFCAMAAARESLDLKIREEGLAGRADLPRFRVYCSEQAHSSDDKAAIALGFGLRGLRKIPVDQEFRMRPDALDRAIEEDRSEGWRPVCVVATVGTTSTTSVDPVPEILDVCRKQNVWLHVDAAYAGPAAILPEKQWILKGCEEADSFLLNPHKWMFVPFDCTAFYTKRPEVLRRTFSLVAEYLRTGEEGTYDFMNYGLQLGRRFRALKLWMVIRMYGVEGIQETLRKHIALAEEFAGWVKDSDDFEMMAPVPFSTVCFRAKPSGYPEEKLNELNENLMHAVNQTGEMYISHTKLHNKITLRLAIGNMRTERAHISRAFELLKSHLGSLRR